MKLYCSRCDHELWPQEKKCRNCNFPTESSFHYRLWEYWDYHKKSGIYPRFSKFSHLKAAPIVTAEQELLCQATYRVKDNLQQFGVLDIDKVFVYLTEKGFELKSMNQESLRIINFDEFVDFKVEEYTIDTWDERIDNQFFVLLYYRYAHLVVVLKGNFNSEELSRKINIALLNYEKTFYPQLALKQAKAPLKTPWYSSFFSFIRNLSFFELIFFILIAIWVYNSCT